MMRLRGCENRCESVKDNPSILVVCTQGQNRSKYLAGYLKSLGYKTDYGGVHENGFNPLAQKQVVWADIIITVRSSINEKFIDKFDHEGKRVIALEVHDNPKRYPEHAQKLIEEESWHAFQEKYVYSQLRKQIQKYLPFKK